MPSTNTTPDTMHSEMVLLYQTSVADLAFFKQGQWSCANYSLLLLAAIPSAALLLGRPLRDFELWISLVLVAAIAAAAVAVLFKHESAIRIRRKRLDVVRDSFSSQFNLAWGVEGKKDEIVSVFGVLVAAILVASGVVLWLLIRRYGA
jgi:hypothetical protein